jgi:hypothetical protein
VKYCAVPPRAQTRNALQPLARNMSRIAAEVRRRSPQAQLIFVGYLPLLPVKGSCERLKLTDAETDWLRWVAATMHVPRIPGSTVFVPQCPSIPMRRA